MYLLLPQAGIPQGYQTTASLKQKFGLSAVKYYLYFSTLTYFAEIQISLLLILILSLYPGLNLCS